MTKGKYAINALKQLAEEPALNKFNIVNEYVMWARWTLEAIGVAFDPEQKLKATEFKVYEQNAQHGRRHVLAYKGNQNYTYDTRLKWAIRYVKFCKVPKWKLAKEENAYSRPMKKEFHLLDDPEDEPQEEMI